MKIKLGQYLARGRAAGPGDRAARDRSPRWIRTRSSRSATPTSRPGAAPTRSRRFERLLDVRSRRTASPTRTSAWCTCRRANMGPRRTSLRRALDLDPRLAGAHTALGVVLVGDRAPRRGHRRLEAGRGHRPGGAQRAVQPHVNLAAAGRGRRGPAYGERFLVHGPAAMPPTAIRSVRSWTPSARSPFSSPASVRSKIPHRVIPRNAHRTFRVLCGRRCGLARSYSDGPAATARARLPPLRPPRRRPSKPPPRSSKWTSSRSTESGRFVPGLMPEDLALFEDGKKQSIQNFYLVSHDASRA